MRCSVAKIAVLAVLALGADMVLSGCVQEHLSQDFGAAVRQDIAAQISDPDAHYVGTPAPGSGGSRVALAQDRYQKGKVIPPAAATASNVGISSGSAPTAPQ